VGGMEDRHRLRGWAGRDALCVQSARNQSAVAARKQTPTINAANNTHKHNQVNDDARKPRTRLSFAFIYPDRRGRNVMRQVGMVMVGRPSVDDDKTLQQLSFQTGDLLDVALL